MPDQSDVYNGRPVGYTFNMGKPLEAAKTKGYVPPTVKQIMRWQVSPAAKVVAYFIRLNRDKKNGWCHAPMKQLRKDVGPATSSEQVDKALKDLNELGALEAKPKLGVHLRRKEKRAGRSYRLYRPGNQAYHVKPNTTRRVTKTKNTQSPAQPSARAAHQPKIIGIDAQGEPLPPKKILRIDPETGESINE